MNASSVIYLVTGEEHDVPEWARQKVEDDSEKIVGTICRALSRLMIKGIDLRLSCKSSK